VTENISFTLFWFRVG